jgi:hypothetical protein
MSWDNLLGIPIGIGLAAACGFRVFVPLLVASVAGMTGVLPLSPGFAWLASMPALVTLAIATVLEVGAYYVPWLDHLLDIVATPSAVVAGIVASASVVSDLPPVVKWGTALVLGGGAAGIVQGATVLTRVKSTAVTAGIANPLVSTIELVGSVVTSVLAIVIPGLVLLLVIAFCVVAFRAAGRFAFGRRAAEASRGSSPPR